MTIKFTPETDPATKKKQQILLRHCKLGEVVRLFNGRMAIVACANDSVRKEACLDQKCLLLTSGNCLSVAHRAAREAISGSGGFRIVERLGTISEIKFNIQEFS